MKKNSIAVFLLIIAFIIGGYGIYTLLNNKATNNIELSWKESKYDNEKFIMPSMVKLELNTSKDIDINKIKYTATCGKVKSNKLEVDWDLTNEDGKCKIVAKYNNNEISKEIVIVNLNNDNKLYLEKKFFDDNPDKDTDYDGLTNEEEKKYNTDPELKDTDMDGLSDYDEINKTKTDPNKEDTDNDGINDYDEVELKLDPNKKDTYGDGTIDGKRKLTYNYENDNIKITLKGKGNIASVVVDVITTTSISKKEGLIDKLYSLYTDGELEEATITIPYTMEELKKYSLKEDKLSIYYFNTKTSKYEKVDSIVDKENKTISAKLKHFSDYVVGDESLLNTNTKVNVLFILDNSWSLYSKEQYEKYSGKEFPEDKKTGYGYDVNGKRFIVTKKLVESLASKDYNIGLSEFRSDYARALSIGSDKDSIINTLDNMTGKFITKTEGTNIGNALQYGIKEFNNKKDENYIIILTDGDDPSLSSNYKNVISSALSKNVKVCSIGFGEGNNNSYLADISNSTGCKYFAGGTADGLEELFNSVGTKIDNDLVDIDGDNEPDGVLVADSGFIVNRDGFSFSNYSTNLSVDGHCHGMATVAEFFYKKVLPLNYGKRIIKDYNEKNPIYYVTYPYDLNDIDIFKNNGNLYDYKLKTDVLKYDKYLGTNLNRNDLYELKDNKLVYKDDIRKEILDSNVYDIYDATPGLSKSEQQEKYGFTYDSYEELRINEDKIQESNVADKDDVMLLNAILVLYFKQEENVYFASSLDFITWSRDKIGNDIIEKTSGNAFLNILKSRLNDGDPLTLTINHGAHIVNAIDLVQDIKNSNIYHIGIYDNNYPGEKRYIDMKCKNDTCTSIENDYYKEKSPLLITPSLEKDLEFFK